MPATQTQMQSRFCCQDNSYGERIWNQTLIGFLLHSGCITQLWSPLQHRRRRTRNQLPVRNNPICFFLFLFRFNFPLMHICFWFFSILCFSPHFAFSHFARRHHFYLAIIRTFNKTCSISISTYKIYYNPINMNEHKRTAKIYFCSFVRCCCCCIL